MLIASRYIPPPVIDYLNICQSVAKNNRSSKDSFFFPLQGATFFEWVIDGWVQQGS